METLYVHMLLMKSLLVCAANNVTNFHLEVRIWIYLTDTCKMCVQGMTQADVHKVFRSFPSHELCTLNVLE